MSEFRKFIAEQLSDPKIRPEWDVLEPEFATIQAMIDARKISSITQKELSEHSGISKIEIGNANL